MKHRMKVVVRARWISCTTDSKTHKSVGEWGEVRTF